jgi:hypothetical protein
MIDIEMSSRYIHELDGQRLNTSNVFRNKNMYNF